MLVFNRGNVSGVTKGTGPWAPMGHFAFGLVTCQLGLFAVICMGMLLCEEISMMAYWIHVKWRQIRSDFTLKTGKTF